MTDHDDSLSEDELLALPQQAPGALSRLWTICSRLIHPHEANEFNCETDAPLRTLFPWNNPHPTKPPDRLEYEQAMRDIGERRDRLLLCTGDEQRKIDERRKDIDDNALRLRDGRRVYVDGDRCRDGEGRVLTGVDEAEAARQHEYRPDVSTWQRKQDIDRRADENQKLTDKILKDRQGGQDTPEQTSERLDAYEKEFAGKAQARQNGAPARSLRKDALHGAGRWKQRAIHHRLWHCPLHERFRRRLSNLRRSRLYCRRARCFT